jgi:hypothetical protein
MCFAAADLNGSYLALYRLYLVQWTVYGILLGIAVAFYGLKMRKRLLKAGAMGAASRVRLTTYEKYSGKLTDKTPHCLDTAHHGYLLFRMHCCVHIHWSACRSPLHSRNRTHCLVHTHVWLPRQYRRDVNLVFAGQTQPQRSHKRSECRHKRALSVNPIRVSAQHRPETNVGLGHKIIGLL